MDQTAVHENGKKLLFLIISDGCAVRVLEVSDRDRSLEDADKVVVPGLFSLSTDTVRGSHGEERTAPTFSPALFYAGERPARFEKRVRVR